MDKADKKKERKAGKRANQLAALEKKMAGEKQYFEECLNASRRGNHAAPKAAEQQLFSKQGAQGINFSNYDNIPVEVKMPRGAAAFDPISDFEELALPAFLARNLSLMRYQKPTPIQRYAVTTAAAGHDLMCCAQTGSGKTAAFLVPVCSRLGPIPRQNNSNVRQTSAVPRCIIMAPTRELASQIELEAQKLTNASPLRSVAVYGGADQKKQIKELAMGVDIIVATPGRLTDFCDRKIVSLASTEFLILDEADRMLDMGFAPQIRRIVLQCDMPAKEQRQTFLFSATFPAAIQLLAQQFLRPYVWVGVGRVGSTTDSIRQQLVRSTLEKRHKLFLVAQALNEGPSGRTLVFVQKKRTATWLKKMLAKGGVDGASSADRFEPITACDIHGDRSQSQREAALAAFRSGSCRVLVATDVAARGLDIADVEHVINMDLPVGPEDFDSYIHRIGRTGRAGHTGLATSLYVPGSDKAANGKIAPLLLNLFREANQEIPEWFASLPECSPGSRTNVTQQGYGGHRPPQAPVAQKAQQRPAPQRGAAAEGAAKPAKPSAGGLRWSDMEETPDAYAKAPSTQLKVQAMAFVKPPEEKRYEGSDPPYTWSEFAQYYGQAAEQHWNGATVYVAAPAAARHAPAPAAARAESAKSKKRKGKSKGDTESRPQPAAAKAKKARPESAPAQSQAKKGKDKNAPKISFEQLCANVDAQKSRQEKADNPPSVNKSKGRKKKGSNGDGPAAQTKEKHPDQAKYALPKPKSK